MNVDVFRERALTTRKHELTSAASSQSASLRALHVVTALLTKNNPLSALLNCNLNDLSAAEADEVSWLKANCLQSGHRFDEASLPAPTIQHDAPSIYASLPHRHTSPSSDTAHAAHKADVRENEAAVALPLKPTDAMATCIVQHPPVVAPGASAKASLPSGEPTQTQTGVSIDGGSAPPGLVAPPEPEDQANFSAATKELLNLESPRKPARTVHLPPENVQEERLREREEERRRKPSVDGEKAARLSHLHTQGDVASSPSSTVGAYSAATPMPTQESPDTSPDSEPLRVDIPQDLRPSPEEQLAKERHDRQLAAQKELARQQALGDVNTPDDQLKWEEREAAARDAEEQAASEDVKVAQPEADVSADGEAANVAVEQKRPRAPIDSRQRSSELTEAHSVQDQQQVPDTESDDEDNITVTPRINVPRVAEAAAPKPPSRATPPKPSGTQEQQKADVASLKPRLSTVPPVPPRRRASSVEPVSPKTSRRTLLTATPAIPQTPRHVRTLPLHQPSPPKSFNAVSELASLKGAADDPDRDYLEPLFRIQAHDSPNLSTVALPDLVKSATKTLSTEDYFTTTHERVDFRMLRRIYQLQNANKWPLRQMEKCREPPQPTTHQDRIMAEMKWMGKDFRAERKMKKSVAAWLAQRCAEWVAADAVERKRLQVKVKSVPEKVDNTEDDPVPDLESSGESAPEDDAMPRTPKLFIHFPSGLVVAPELMDHVSDLQKNGSLRKALHDIPTWRPELPSLSDSQPMAQVSKFVQGKVLPKQQHPLRKRSRYDYDDEAEAPEVQPGSKPFRSRAEHDLPPEDQEIALFHPDNKHIRDRLHANNAFRPPSEFQMPSTQFYETRNGSQWIWDDDQQLRALAKDYSFNWSLIAEECALPSAWKSGMERRTPWECFERWVELEQLPAEMRKTVYFKTWFQRLDQSQQAVDRRYSAQVAAVQAAHQQNGGTGQPPNLPMRRRTLPARVEKRKSTRHLWVVDAMRKLARKHEAAAYKQAEAQRAAAQRKTSQQNESNQPARGPMPTPQEFSKKRYERDLQMAEMARQHRAKMIEAQQRQQQMNRAAQQGMVPGAPNQQRPGTAGQAQPQAQGQQPANMSTQAAQQQRQGVPVPTRNGHLAVPPNNHQGIPQAHMRAGQPMTQPADMQRMAQANAQGRQGQYAGQQYAMQNANNMASPGGSAGMTTQQQLHSNQALLAAFQAQNQNQTQSNQQQPHGQHQSPNQSSHPQGSQMNGQQQQHSASPSMPPPPTPQGVPQQLSSGHVPAVIAIKNQLRNRYPTMTEPELTNFATEQLKHQSQSSSQVRQNAMNAAAGINNTAPSTSTANMQAYNQNQQAYQNNANMSNGTNGYANGDSTQQQQTANGGAGNQGQHNYAQMMRQRQMAQMSQMRMQQSPNTPHAQLNGSPNVANASPSTNPASPSVQYQGVNNVPNMPMNTGVNGQGRPPSRSNTPQMQRLGSSGGVPGVNGMQSPGALQGSPRNMQASMAR